MAKTKNGQFEYAKSFGTRSLDPESSPLDFQSVFFLASMTKFLTSIAAMQVVEKGLIHLDDDVSRYIPELAEQRVLSGWDSSGAPVLSERKNAIKFVHLLTHSAGTNYELLSPLLRKYRETTGTGPQNYFKDVLPLAYEPGTSWGYGFGTDWAGLVIERLTGDSLQVFMQKNIFDPLGIKQIAFAPHITPEMKENLARMTKRDRHSGRVVDSPGDNMISQAAECHGGDGAYANLQDYFKIVFSILADDEVLLKKESTAVMFSPQFTPEAKAGYKNFMAYPTFKAVFIGDMPDDVEYDWGVGGLLLDTDDRSSRRRKGFMMWSGMPNLFWVTQRTLTQLGMSY
ncbi:beta-lactamase family protein [Aureobasidium sp. EXF-10728]|nr:beta-lactamase family protein [Aureobasidium sp. EXF-10728]